MGNSRHLVNLLFDLLQIRDGCPTGPVPSHVLAGALIAENDLSAGARQFQECGLRFGRLALLARARLDGFRLAHDLTLAHF